VPPLTALTLSKSGFRGLFSLALRRKYPDGMNYQGFRERMKMSSTDGLRNRSLGTRKPLKPSGVTGFDLQKCGDRCWVRTNAG